MANFLKTITNLRRLKSAYITTNELINLRLPATPKDGESPLHYFRPATGLSNEIDKILSNFNDDADKMIFKTEKMLATIDMWQLRNEDIGDEDIRKVKRQIKHLEKKIKELEEK